MKAGETGSQKPFFFRHVERSETSGSYSRLGQILRFAQDDGIYVFLIVLLFFIFAGSIFAAEADWSLSEKVIVVLPFKSQNDSGKQLADSVQIRLRSQIQENKLNAYVVSWAEMEIYGISDEKDIAKKLELSLKQQLIVLSGELQQSGPNSFKAVLCRGDARVALFEANDERWKPIISEKITDYVLNEILAFKEKPKLAETMPTHWGSSIVINGGFDDGKGFKPKGWEQVDNLCSYWVNIDKGKCLMFDTDVLQDQAWEWWKSIKAGANPADAPKPIRTNPPHYDAVGGIEGAKLYSDFLPAMAGKTYLVSVRIKGPRKGTAKIFVKAYAELPTAKSEKLTRREVWQTYLNCETKENEWKNFEMNFTLPESLPTVEKKIGKGKTKTYQPKIQWIRVMPFAYWQVGKYYIDDIRLQPASR